MKTLYLDCGMGAAGDMLTAALWELLPEKEEFLQKMNSLGLPGVKIQAQPSVKCGITGTHMSVTVDGAEEDQPHHHHAGMEDVTAILAGLDLPEPVKADVCAVYNLIAQAESRVHGVPVTQIHFHEVGTLDAIADVSAVCLLIHLLAPEQILASPVHVGSGTVRCAHGILPVPAPATALLLQDIPIYGGQIQGELCTPTGAALLKHFVTKFGDMPPMQVRAMGYGMGKKDFPRVNCVRAMLGDTAEARPEILQLSCNVDDMTGEAMGFALERLLAEGALEAFTIPVNMKKSRPGVLLCVLCREEDREKMVSLLFRHTSTIGIREASFRRHTLDRRIETVPTPYGPVRRKISTGCGVTRVKDEFEDLAAIARKENLSLSELADFL